MTVFPPHHETLDHVTKDNWRELAGQKKRDTSNKIPKAWLLPEGKFSDLQNVLGVPAESGLLEETELEITEIDDADVLAARVANKRYTALQVTTAFCKRAAIAHQLCNCLTEVFFEMAIKRAIELDAYLQKTGKTAGPLHGVPISLKDQFDVKGTELTMGYASYLGRVSKANASLVDLLLDAGAVIYVRTNVPQTLMMGDTFNHVFGRTHNPWNRKLSPGGSSGGEGALIAMKGSIIGVGTDIGGSVRMPSAFCGLYTLRPSTRRVPYGKATNSLLGQECILSVAGPMCRSLRSVEFFMKTVLDANPSDYDASALPFPYSDSLYQRVLGFPRLAFGFARTDGHVTPTKPVDRAMDITIQALRAAGHEVFEFDLLRYKRLWPLVIEAFAADGGADIRQVLSKIEEPIIPGLALGGPEDEKTVYQLQQLNREKESIQQAVLAEWMATKVRTKTGRPMDALIFPVCPHVAPPPGGSRHPGYTAVFNALDLPVCVVPVTKVDPAIDVKTDDIPCLNETDQFIQENYYPELSAGVPVAVQIIGRRWQDEALLAITSKVIEAVGYH